MNNGAIRKKGQGRTASGTRRRTGAGLLALAVGAGLLAGCAAESESGGARQEEGPTKITMLLPYFSTEAPKENPIIEELEALTDTELDITWVPNAAYKDKLSVSLSSNDLKQVSVINNLDGGIYAPAITSGVQAGAFWEIGPYLADYPNLSTRLNKDVLQNATHDGKNYALYRPRVLARGGVLFRKDWLEAVGLEEPKTIDDLYQVIRAFAEEDPDGNGKRDTYGLISRKGMADLDMLAGFYGAGNGYSEEDGKLVPSFMSEAYLDALRFYKRLYDEQLMNPDFAVTEGNQSKELLAGGKGGLVISTAIDDVVAGDASAKETNPDAALDVVSRIQGPAGERIMASPGYNGIFMFPKTAIKSEEQLRDILAFFDKMFEPESANLLIWGIEGEHYHLEDGKVAFTEEEQERRLKDKDPIPQLSIIQEQDSELKAEYAPLLQKVKTMFADNEPIAVSNPALSIQSPTLSEKSGELEKIVADAKVKFILGEIDEEGWRAELEKWEQAGGAQALEEINAEYARRQQQ
ncbi:extracellular solute-binding protein [Paenibacillus sp. IB182496]|uniref:Extracellular solute-binding protein n=1 Tax=Paenibacillus sabuli TaxID=2772509 RepID=A0A927GRI4_9BACL|nr:extracellular solute-binding protein [Paenibacillus sabuli]MBD2845010.1 extracellular solute-binding protein [Paenibacillus sabuli]